MVFWNCLTELLHYHTLLKGIYCSVNHQEQADVQLYLSLWLNIWPVLSPPTVRGMELKVPHWSQS